MKGVAVRSSSVSTRCRLAQVLLRIDGVACAGGQLMDWKEQPRAFTSNTPFCHTPRRWQTSGQPGLFHSIHAGSRIIFASTQASRSTTTLSWSTIATSLKIVLPTACRTASQVRRHLRPPRLQHNPADPATAGAADLKTPFRRQRLHHPLHVCPLWHDKQHPRARPVHRHID
ncbi:hypothetical protein DM02DRAFT_678819 [Periconia macrospinosa]|uniref:Uncharacterized protein n=1 Tax=Periconia macrospinosa TaxID=97972 RepID=A0A2V1CY07_9PLEO|nr:hypothetical protein DM02DRAFT_678819 [Periconia macrospinosa]